MTTTTETGTFEEWYEIYRDEGYEPEQAESMAYRSARSSQPLPEWYTNPNPDNPYIQSDNDIDTDQPTNCDDIPF